ncbi:MAG: prepilin-type N-terminal cleavage/methylation domain-containing protein [Kiritimatiellia bacterium]
MSARKGFTLIELLVVIVIIAILVALVVGVFGGAQASGRRAGCSSNLNQIGKAYISYANDNADNLPFYVDAPTELWARRLGNYMGIQNTGSDPEPTLMDCSKSKAFLSPMALNYAKKNGLKINADRQLTYGNNHQLNTKLSVAALPRRMSEFEYPTQTMLTSLTQRDEAVKGWKLRGEVSDFNASTAEVYKQSGTKDLGMTAVWMDGRAQFLKYDEVPNSGGQALANWKDSTGKEYAYSYGMFWQGIAVYDSTKMP